jgi:hypothetical protein
MNKFTKNDAIAQSLGLKKISLEELRRRFNLSPDAEFRGYLIHIEAEDEFLAFIKETEFTTQRAFTKSPEIAHIFDEFGDAFKYVRKEKNEIIVGMFETKKQILIYPIE